MRIVERVPSAPYQVTKYRVQCEGCDGTFILTAWKGTITPDRRCASCGAKGRVKRLAKLRGAA